jgi:hypothetical protein
MKTPDADELLELVCKAESLLPRKWISLEKAREYVLALLAGPRRPSTQDEREDRARAIDGETTTTKFGGLFAMADRQGRSLLLRALAAGDLESRGMEQLPDQVMHEPLASKWWQRVVEAGKFTLATPENPIPRYTGSTSVGDEFPVNEVSWLDGAIRLRKPGSQFFEHPLAIVTGVEINHAQLFKLVKPLIDAYKEAASTAPRDLLAPLISEMERLCRQGEPRSQKKMFTWINGEFLDRKISQEDFAKLFEQVPQQYRGKGGRRPKA